MSKTEIVLTSIGAEPVDRAVMWHLPTMLRWIAKNPDETHMPCGFRCSQVLQAAADLIQGPTEH